MLWYKDRIVLFTLLGIVLFFSLLQFQSSTLVGVDGYYHIKYAALTLEQGILNPFAWWTASIHSVADGHFLFHLLLIPFTFLGLTLGGKIAAIVLASCSVFALFLYLYSRIGKDAVLWVLVFFAFGSQALFRFNLTRPHVGAFCLFILYSYFLFSKKIWHLGVLTFLFVWYYPAFNLLALMLALWVGIVYLLERKIVVKEIIATGVGCLAGLVINPFFPDNIRLIYLQVVNVLFFPVKDVHIFPADIQSYSSFGEFFSFFWFVFLLSVFCYVLVLRKRLYDKEILFFGCWALVNFLLLLRFLRFIEYWVPFTLIFCALVLHKSYLKEISQKSFRVLFCVLIGLSIVSLIIVGGQIAKASDVLGFDQYGECITWLQENTPEGSVVVTNWYEFPPIFFYNDHNYYLFGEDPHYLYFYNTTMYHTYEDVLFGTSVNPARDVSDVLGARYILANKQLMSKWVAYLDVFSSTLIKRVDTAYCSVYEVRS